jgi:FkbM family methyltransferase
MVKSPIKAFKWINKKFNSNPLTKNNKTSAFLRYIKFNLHQFVFRKEKVYPFLKNTKFYAKRGQSGIVPNIYFGLHELEEMSFLLHYLKENDTFLDIGANVGAYTILASGEAKCRSIAIEPIPSTFNYLKRNIELNQLDDKVKLYNIGVSNKNDNLYFTNNKDSMNHVVKNNSPNSIMVEVHTIDEIIKEKISFIKIDVEGYEKYVLDGTKRILNEDELNVIQIELNSFGKKYNSFDPDIHDLLQSYGFKPYKYHPFQRYLEELKTYRTDQYNTIYIKNKVIADQRVKDASNIRIRNFSF